ncbi:HYR domain-containing protein [Phaeodactylibacter xiamenensis]|uniref:HYR domain-containing protein n=1 Tax=Phaeodactylibacter xiamenensis TaxID=1524460 RepID=UPI0024A9BACB|nr:HYR domain-containing protein [Phaeodactylibacter xiamenensis]
MACLLLAFSSLSWGAVPIEGALLPPTDSVLYVNPSLPSSGNGYSWDQAFNNLQYALHLAENAPEISEIWLAAGHYYPDEGIDITNNVINQFIVKRSNLALYGGFSGQETVRNQRNWKEHLTVIDGDINQSGTTEGNAFSMFFIDYQKENITVDGLVFRNNYTEVANGAVTVQSSSKNIRFSNCTIEKNAANIGAAIIVAGGAEAEFTNCIIRDNYADSQAGAVWVPRGDARFINCLFVNNTSPNENFFVSYEENFNFSSGSAAFINCTIIDDNHATGKAVFMIQDDNDFGIGSGDPKDSVIVLYNTIVWGNSNLITDQLSFTDFSQPQPTLKISHSILDGTYPGENVMDEDPQFDTSYYAPPRITSPARNAGSTEGAPAFDLNGVARTGLPDIGAFEIPCTTIAEAGNDSDGSICAGDEVNLSENGGEAISWSWMGPGGFSSNEQNPYIAAALPGDYIVTIINGQDCTASDTTTVEGDTEAPLIECPADTIVSISEGGCTYTGIPWDTILMSDNCSGVDALQTSLMTGEDGQPSYMLGTNTIELTIEDEAGNKNRCQFQLTVVDDLPPTAKCKNVTVEMQESGLVTVSKEALDGGSYTECGSFSLSTDSELTFTCEDGDFHIVTLIVTDDSNQLTAQCEAQIVIEDPNNFCCAPASAICQEVTVVLAPNGQGTLLPEEIGGNSITECGLASESISQSFFDCDDIGSTINVTYTITDFNGASDQCSATVSVEEGNALPAGWSATNIGDQGDGSDFNYSLCSADSPNNGDLNISTGSYNLLTQNADNLAFANIELCNDGGIQARIESVDGGYAGLMIRESDAPGAKMVAVYSNLTNLIRREIRTTDNGPKSSTLIQAPFPYWLRLQRDGDLIRARYRSSSLYAWQTFYQAYLPMNSCVEMGLAVFTTDPNGSASATFGDIRFRNNLGGINLSAPDSLYWENAQPEVLKATIVPNPVRRTFTLQFSAALPADGTAALFNEFGQQLAQTPLREGEQSIDWDASYLPAGLYFLEVFTQDGYREVLKVVRQ